MAVRVKHSAVYSMYFCTFTCYQWISLFEIASSYDCVYKWFDYLKTRKIDMVGYVIMPNHVHCILYFPNDNFDLNKIISNAKRFIAYEIIKRLTTFGNIELLNVLSDGVSERERKKGQKHKVFEDSFDAKPIFSAFFMNQKLNYIHYNPVRGKWRLVDDFVKYEHSSASFYELGTVHYFLPVHYKDVGA